MFELETGREFGNISAKFRYSYFSRASVKVLPRAKVNVIPSFTQTFNLD